MGLVGSGTEAGPAPSFPRSLFREEVWAWGEARPLRGEPRAQALAVHWQRPHRAGQLTHTISARVSSRPPSVEAASSPLAID